MLDYMASRQILFRTDCSDEEQACVWILRLFSFLMWTEGNTFGLSINSCITPEAQLILKTNLINGYCSARARTCLLTHFRSKGMLPHAEVSHAIVKQRNVLLPCREINLKFWARVISCFAWHFTATQRPLHSKILEVLERVWRRQQRCCKGWNPSTLKTGWRTEDFHLEKAPRDLRDPASTSRGSRWAGEGL